MNIYVLSTYSNGYQRERIENFLKSEKVNVVNPDFGFPYCGFSRKEYDEWKNKNNLEKIMAECEQFWVIVPHYLLIINYFISDAEKVATKLKLNKRYFKINVNGRYIGRVKEIERKELERY
jgi:hypothetical protein